MICYQLDVPVITPGKAEYTPKLFAYIPQNNLDIPLNSHRPGLIIFPGGGYHFTYDGEAEPVALNFTSAGVCVFILRYSCAPAFFPQQLCEGLWCVKYVREHAEEYGIDPANISVMGFSAGGHLCASVGTLWQQSDIWKDYLPAKPVEYRPDKMVLCYPVISSAPDCIHMGTYKNLTHSHMDDESLMRLNSLDLQVTDQTPPAFLWHTFEDESVPVKNSLLFAEAEERAGNLVELHIYPRGYHGLATGDYTVKPDFAFDVPHTIHDWMHQAVRFIFDENLSKRKQ